MTRGRHARAAENRQAREAETVQAYQRRVAKLTAEIKALKAEQRDRENLHAQVLKRVKAERDAGLSPALLVAQREARRLREERDAAKAHDADTLKKYHHVIDQVLKHFKGVHGLNGEEAMAAFMNLVDGGQARLIDWDHLTKLGIGGKEGTTLAKVRGRADLAKVKRAVGGEQ